MKNTMLYTAKWLDWKGGAFIRRDIHVGSNPTFAIIQPLGVTATRQVLILKLWVQIPRELRMGYWYNGFITADS